MDILTNLWLAFVSKSPDAVIAIIYLIIAFVVALIAKKIVMGILRKLGAEKLLAKSGIKDEKTGNSTEFIGKLVFLIVFLLFLPAVLARLGMSNVASPITSVITAIIGFLPNLLAAGIILYIGVYVAKVIKQLIKALLGRIGLDKLQKKLGVEAVQDQNTFTGVLAGIIYIIILIPVIIAALQVLGIDAISAPATTILAQIFSCLPNIFVAIILFVVGYQLAKIFAPIVESLLVSVGVDKLSENVSQINEASKIKFSVSKVAGQIVRWLIMVIFFVEAVNLLNLDIITNIGTAILGYLPSVISAVIILGGGIILASWLERLITNHSPKHKTLALITKIVIIILAAFMTLSQLGFAQSIVSLSFVIILTGAAVAFAIAFGIGGRTFAANCLAKLENKLDDTDKTN
jgi:hypothetical protein